MKSETMGIVTELRSTCETKLPHIKTKKANENKEILNLKSYTKKLRNACNMDFGKYEYFNLCLRNLNYI